MTRESLATWMFLCVPLWLGLAVWSLARGGQQAKITGAVLVVFAVAGLMTYFTSVLAVAVRP